MSKLENIGGSVYRESSRHNSCPKHEYIPVNFPTFRKYTYWWRPPRSCCFMCCYCVSYYIWRDSSASTKILGRQTSTSQLAVVPPCGTRALVVINASADYIHRTRHLNPDFFLGIIFEIVFGRKKIIHRYSAVNWGFKPLINYIQNIPSLICKLVK